MGRASERRVARVGSLLLETVNGIIAAELNDPRLGMWTITGVRVSPDLAHATFSVSTLAGGKATEDSVGVLNRAAPLLWNQLRSQTDLRVVPKLHFEIDRGGEYLDEISRLIDQLPPPSADYGQESRNEDNDSADTREETS
jgi:ribosome-binding factor A